jgi:hypothetical protein
MIAVLQDLRKDLQSGAAIDTVFASANRWREILLANKT